MTSFLLLFKKQPDQNGETPSLLKIQKISWVWWWAPIIPATQEAEAGESLEPRRRTLQWDEVVPLHSSLGNKSETLSPKKKERKRLTRYSGSCPLSQHLVNQGGRTAWGQEFKTSLGNIVRLYLYKINKRKRLYKNAYVSMCVKYSN